MSDALTNAASAALNAARRLKRLDRPLLLLVHATGEGFDYSTIAKLRSGFLIQTTTEGVELRICESADATPLLLEQMNGVAFDEKVYAIKGSDKVRPLGAPLLWKFALKPTKEPYR
jgi:hypothetical protein